MRFLGSLLLFAIYLLSSSFAMKEIRVICFDFQNMDEFEFRAMILMDGNIFPMTKDECLNAFVPDAWRNGAWRLKATLTNPSLIAKWNAFLGANPSKRLITISFDVSVKLAASGGQNSSEKTRPCVNKYAEGSLWKIEVAKFPAPPNMVDHLKSFVQSLGGDPSLELELEFLISDRKYFVHLLSLTATKPLCFVEGEMAMKSREITVPTWSVYQLVENLGEYVAVPVPISQLGPFYNIKKGETVGIKLKLDDNQVPMALGEEKQPWKTVRKISNIQEKKPVLTLA